MSELTDEMLEKIKDAAINHVVVEGEEDNVWAGVLVLLAEIERLKAELKHAKSRIASLESTYL
jgi:uncharacterized small protein (DUF1192 family)